MAASEGQLALEFVRTLSEEAAAHRAYLQLLYSVTIGSLLVGLAATAAFIGWMWQRSIKVVRDAVEAEFRDKILSIIEKREEEAVSAKNKINEAVTDLQKFRLDAQSELDTIARITAKIRNNQKEEIKKPDDFIEFAAIVRSPEEEWVSGTVFAQFDSYVETSNISIDDLSIFFDGKPSVFVITQKAFLSNKNKSIELYNKYSPGPPIIFVYEEVNEYSLLNAIKNLSEFPGRGELVSGPSHLLNALQGYKADRKNR